MKKAIIFFLLGAAVLGTILYIGKTKEESTGGIPALGPSFTTSSSTAYLLTTTSVRVMATSSNRTWASFSNNSAEAVYLMFNQDNAAVVNTGILVAASSTYQITGDNLYVGSVRALASSNMAAPEALMVMEATY